MQALESELGIFEDVCNQSYLDISHPQTRTKNVISRRLSLKVMAAQLVLRSTPANLARWVPSHAIPLLVVIILFLVND